MEAKVSEYRFRNEDKAKLICRKSYETVIYFKPSWWDLTSPILQWDEDKKGKFEINKWRKSNEHQRRHEQVS